MRRVSAGESLETAVVIVNMVITRKATAWKLLATPHRPTWLSFSALPRSRSLFLDICELLLALKKILKRTIIVHALYKSKICPYCVASDRALDIEHSLGSEPIRPTGEGLGLGRTEVPAWGRGRRAGSCVIHRAGSRTEQSPSPPILKLAPHDLCMTSLAAAE